MRCGFVRAAAGNTFVHDGVRLYYEVYGAGEPLLLVHGNGGSIAISRAQIDYFRRRYRVIAMDSRDQGKSADSPGQADLREDDRRPRGAARPPKVGPVNVLGLERRRHRGAAARNPPPRKVKKIAAMAANLNPSRTRCTPRVHRARQDR